MTFLKFFSSPWEHWRGVDKARDSKRRKTEDDCKGAGPELHASGPSAPSQHPNAATTKNSVQPTMNGHAPPGRHVTSKQALSAGPSLSAPGPSTTTNPSVRLIAGSSQPFPTQLQKLATLANHSHHAPRQPTSQPTTTTRPPQQPNTTSRPPTHLSHTPVPSNTAATLPQPPHQPPTQHARTTATTPAAQQHSPYFLGPPRLPSRPDGLFATAVASIPTTHYIQRQGASTPRLVPDNTPSSWGRRSLHVQQQQQQQQPRQHHSRGAQVSWPAARGMGTPGQTAVGAGARKQQSFAELLDTAGQLNNEHEHEQNRQRVRSHFGLEAYRQRVQAEAEAEEAREREARLAPTTTTTVGGGEIQAAGAGAGPAPSPALTISTWHVQDASRGGCGGVQGLGAGTVTQRRVTMRERFQQGHGWQGGGYGAGGVRELLASFSVARPTPGLVTAGAVGRDGGAVSTGGAGRASQGETLPVSSTSTDLPVFRAIADDEAEAKKGDQKAKELNEQVALQLERMRTGLLVRSQSRGEGMQHQQEQQLTDLQKLQLLKEQLKQHDGQVALVTAQREQRLKDITTAPAPAQKPPDEEVEEVVVLDDDDEIVMEEHEGMQEEEEMYEEEEEDGEEEGEEELYPEEEEELDDEQETRIIRSNTPEELKTFKEILSRRDPEDTLVVEHARSSVPLTLHSLFKLRDGVWLNDEIINVSMALLQERDLSLYDVSGGRPADALKVHYFSSFFLNKLHKDKGTYNFKEVSRWTRTPRIKKNGQMCASVLDCDRLVFPVHVGKSHWACACIDLKNRRLMYWDSMATGHSPVLDHLAKWIIDESQDKLGGKGSAGASKWADAMKWPREAPTNVPQQSNGCDCGVFAIMFAAYGGANWPFRFRQSDMPVIRRRLMHDLVNLQWTIT